MARCIPILPLLLAVMLLVVSSASATGISGGAGVGWVAARAGCGGTVGECTEGDEFELASESSRRILATSSYISYQSLKRDSVPCSRRGASYYNCRPGAQANPYSRGCSAITRCRS